MSSILAMLTGYSQPTKQISTPIIKENKNKYRDLNFYIHAFLTQWDIYLKSKFRSNYPVTLIHNIKHLKNKFTYSSLDSQEYIN